MDFKTILSVVFLLFASAVLPAQNLIKNPGFEEGVKYWSASLWTRDPNVGISSIVSSPVHTGDSALHIVHWGKQDWSFTSSNMFPVQTGEVYEIGAWVKALQVRSYAEFSVILYDSNKSVMNWSYGAARFDASQLEYKEFSCRFMIPERVRYILPRFIGGDSCDFYADDVDLSLVDSSVDRRSYSLENSSIAVQIDAPSLAMQVTDKISGNRYSMSPSYQFQVIRADSTQDSISLSCLYLQENIPIKISIRLFHDALRFSMKADSAETYRRLFIFPGMIASKPNDYLIVPRAAGMIVPANEQYPFWDFTMYGHKATMSFVGVTNLTSGYMLVSDDPWNTTARFIKYPGDSLYAPLLIHNDQKGLFGHDRTFYFVPIVKNGYVEMCSWYRERAQERELVKTFAEKITENPNIERLRGAVDFWALNSSFKKPAFIDTLVDLGVDRAIISLGGSWYNTEQLTEIIDTVNARGLLSSRYDIYTDVWPPAHPELPWFRTEGFPEDIIVDKDGSLRKGWLAYINGTIPFQGYYACSTTHKRYAEKWISDDLAKNKYNCRFIDVELASALTECYSLTHPITRREDAFHRIALLDHVKNRFRLVTGSEEARDIAFPVVDFGEGTMSIQPANNAGYDWITPIDAPGENYWKYNVNPKYRIPLHGLVFHDTHTPTWYTGDGVSKVPSSWHEKDLFNILYASMPLFMPPSQSYWQSAREKFLTSYHLTSAVFREAGFERMNNHKMLSPNWDVQQTFFANGWNVIANFSTTTYPIAFKTIAPKGFYATNGTHEAYRLLSGNDTIAFVRLADRLFINPYGKEQERCGVRSSGSVFLKKFTDYIHLAFEGEQESIDINPALLPWTMTSIEVCAKGKTTPLQLETLSNGWYRIRKQGNEIFYRVEGTLASVENALSRLPSPTLEIFPNPARHEISLSYSIPLKSHVTIEIVNALGQRIAFLNDADPGERINKTSLDMSRCNPGVYFARMMCGSQTISKRFIIQ